MGLDSEIASESHIVENALIRLANITKYHGEHWKIEKARGALSEIFNDSKSLEDKKSAAWGAWFAFDEHERVDFCLWAWAHKELLTKPIWSKILITTHQHGIGRSLLSAFSLPWRIEMFESANQEHLMDESEYRRFLDLPNELTVYRGGGGIGVTATKLKYGMSWTTDIDRAIWFANRFPHRGEPLVVQANVKKENIFGCFDYEDEIIVRAPRVSKLKVCEIDYKQRMTEEDN